MSVTFKKILHAKGISRQISIYTGSRCETRVVDKGALGVNGISSSNFVLLLQLSITNLSVLFAFFPGCVLLNNVLLSVSLSL
jgi:hypothetical protein